MNPDADSSDTRVFEIMREYVAIQQKLVLEAHSHIDPSASEFTFRDTLPVSVRVDGEDWSTMYHGGGVMFTLGSCTILMESTYGAWSNIESPGSKRMKTLMTGSRLWNVWPIQESLSPFTKVDNSVRGFSYTGWLFRVRDALSRHALDAPHELNLQKAR